MSRVGFIVGGSKASAIRAAQDAYHWQRIAAFRFVTAAKDDIRVIDSIGEFHSFGPRTKIYRAPGFAERPDTAKFEQLIGAQQAIWGEPAEFTSKEKEENDGIGASRTIDGAGGAIGRSVEPGAAGGDDPPHRRRGRPPGSGVARRDEDES